jgi:hypothetical protein
MFPFMINDDEFIIPISFRCLADQLIGTMTLKFDSVCEPNSMSRN